MTRFGVSRIALEGFRNYAWLDLSLGSQFNVLAGSNAQGKTNLLEALVLLSTTRLLRGQRDAEAIMEGRQQARVSAELLDSTTSVGILLERGIRKRATLNGLSVPRAADILGRMPSVCVSTEDMALARGEPADRRLYLDLDLSGLYPAYLNHLTHYKRSLEQRNALLRHAERFQADAAYEPWEEQLARHGAAIRAARARFVEGLQPYASSAHARLGGGEALSIGYQPKDAALSEPELLEALARSRATDAARGGTSVGPHRDDLYISVGGRDARLYGSQGQQRTAVISIKLSSLDLFTRELGAPPLLLLDDIFSDLDADRRSALVDAVLERAGQTLLTCTEPAHAGPRILSQARVYHVSEGAVREA